MNYYDYRSYFETIISLLNGITSKMDTIISSLSSYSGYFDIIIKGLTLIVVCKLFMTFGQVYRGR